MQRAGVPDGAKFYAWAFPLLSIARLSSDELSAFKKQLHVTCQGGGEDDSARPELSFVTNGGFVFADDSFQTVGVSAVCGDNVAIEHGSTNEGEALKLDGPHSLDPSIREKLETTNPWQRPTSLYLRQAGVVSYTWVEPKEGLVSADGKDWHTGSFVFLYAPHLLTDLNTFSPVHAPWSVPNRDPPPRMLPSYSRAHARRWVIRIGCTGTSIEASIASSVCLGQRMKLKLRQWRPSPRPSLT